MRSWMKWVCVIVPQAIAAMYLPAQGQSVYENLPDSLGDDGVSGMVRALDGGYLINLKVDSGVSIMKVDAQLVPQWSKHLDVVTPERFLGQLRPELMRSTADGGAVICSWGGSYTLFDWPNDTLVTWISVVRLTPLGSVEWSRSIKTITTGLNTENYVPQNMALNALDEIFIELDLGTGIPHKLLKLDSQGSPQWLVQNASTCLPYFSLLPDDTGGCYFVNNCGTYFGVEYVAANGQVTWSREYSHAGCSYQNHLYMHFSPDGDVVVQGIDLTSAFIMKIHTDGSPVWYRLFAQPLGNLWGVGFEVAENGQMAVIGTSTALNGTFVTFIDSSGHLSNAYELVHAMSGDWNCNLWLLSADAREDELTFLGWYNMVNTIFGFHTDEPVILTCPFSITDECLFSPVQFAEFDYPVGDLVNQDGDSLAIGNPVVATTLQVASVDDPIFQAADFCGSVSVQEPHEHIIGPSLVSNPISAGTSLQVRDVPPGMFYAFDTTGRLIVKTTSDNSGLLEVSTQGWTSGIYVVKCTGMDGRVNLVDRLVVE